MNMNSRVSFGSYVRRSVVIVAMAFIALAPIMNVQAGYENTSGNAYVNYRNYYDSPRYITDPTAPGPDVAFYKRSGPAGLQLGIWKCPGGGPGGVGESAMVTNAWRALTADRYFVTSGAKFCLFSNSSSGTGPFNGDLNWD